MEDGTQRIKKWLFTCWHPGCGKQFYSSNKKRVIRNVVRKHFETHNIMTTVDDARFADAVEYVEKSESEWKSLVADRKTSNLCQVNYFLVIPRG